MSGERKPRPPVVVWRDCARDSALKSTPKLVALVHSTFMDADGLHFYSRKALARAASLSDRAIDAANETLRDAGYLFWRRHPGGRKVSNRYVATLPETANELHLIEWERAKVLRGLVIHNGEADDVKGEPHDRKGEGGSHDLEGSRRSSYGTAAEGGAVPLPQLIAEPCVGAGCNSQWSRDFGTDTDVLCDACRTERAA